MLAPVAPRIKVNVSLRFCHQVLRLDHLTYGLWDGDRLDLEGLRAAQERFADKLLGWIPEGVHRVLDVGAGVGANAQALEGRGFEVEGLSPDPYQQAIFQQRTGLPFHLTRFENLKPAAPYDLVLMSESAQYIFFDRLFGAVEQAAPGGHWLVADYFLRDGAGGPLAKSGHAWSAFLAESRKHGFELLREEDITERVLPTLDLAASWLRLFGWPAWHLLADTAADRYPILSKVAGWLLGRRLSKIRASLALLDSVEFAKQKSYRMALFRVPELRRPSPAAG